MKTIINILFIATCILMSVETAFAQSNALKKAGDYFEQAEYSKSIELYKKVLKKDESNKVAMEQIAHAHRLLNQSAEAEYWYQKAMIFNSNKPLLKFHYAQTLMTNGKYLEAAKYFEEYAQKVPYDSRGAKFAESCRNIEELQQDTYMYQVEKFHFNSSGSDVSPSFYEGGILFVSQQANQKTIYSTTNNNGRQWSSPNPLPAANPNHHYEGSFSFNKAGDKVYFTRNVGKENDANTSHLKMYEANVVGNQWTNVREMSFNNNFYSVGSPSISANGRTLYFSSNMPGGYGGMDIYVSLYENGTWTKPQNLGKNINSEGDEVQPFVHPNGALYFASNGLGGFGGFDLFGAVRTNSIKWEVKNVGAPINSSNDDLGLILTGDFQKGYLSSNRKGGKGNFDIYQISINEAKAAEMLAKTPSSSSLHTFQTNYLKSKNKKAESSTFHAIIKKYNLQRDLKLVLVGIVLNEETKEPIEGAQVMLEDLVSTEKQKFVTQKDGNFYFKLEAERQYKLFKVNSDGSTDPPTDISTVNKDETQILHAVLESTSSASNNLNNNQQDIPLQAKDLTPADPNTDVFKVNKSVERAMSSTYNNGRYSDSQLVFKIQIGAFRQKLDANSDFLSKVRGEVETEKTRNGLIRYMMGKFDDFANAEQFRIRLLRQGYTKAFVAAYINNVRLDMPVEEVLQRY